MTNPHAKKYLGQHWLINRHWLEKMIVAAELKPTETVLEIGPGAGVLTEALLTRSAKVIAIEKDRDLIPILNDKFSTAMDSGQLTLIQGDILKFKPTDHNLSRYKVIANIPYYLTGRLLVNLLTADNQPQVIVLMIQKEVAQRLIGRPAGPDRPAQNNLLYVSVAAFGRVKYLATVSRGNFRPIPAVDSAIVVIDQINRDKFAGDRPTEADFFRIVKAGFSQKRKLLTGNLACSPDDLVVCGLNPKARAENLSIDQWLCLTKVICNK